MGHSNSTHNTSADDYKRAFEMQKKAREQAEKLLEEKSRELYLKNQSLERALEKLGQQQMQLVAQEKLASIGQLGAGLAHELNNPNAFIQNNLVTLNEYILQLISGMDQSFEIMNEFKEATTQRDQHIQIETKIDHIRQQSDLDFIRNDLTSIIDESLNGSKRITNIANGLRCFANPDVSTRKIFDVNECIRQTLQLMPFDQQQPEAIDIRFELEPLPQTTGIPILLSQALANIIQNSMESEPTSKQITIHSKQVDDTILITIQDDGTGISKNNISNVFQPFFTNKPAHNGLGLGIAQSIITQHQGSIHIDSTEGKGTVVTIKLPLKFKS